MKTCNFFALGALFGLAPLLNAVDIPEDVPGAPGSGRDPGFIVRSAQAFESPPPPDGKPLPPTLNRGIFQLNGTLTDDFGTLLGDESKPGPNDGAYVVQTINFQKDAIVEEVIEPIEGEPAPAITNFQPNALFPGIPGDNGHTTNFVTEVVAYLELTAGEHTFGGQVWVERTDVGGDDFFVVQSGTNPRDFLNLQVAEYIKAGAPAFMSVPNDFTYTVTVPTEGLYPFRLVFLQDALGAALEWYSVDAETGDKILINDSDDDRAIKAFQSSTATHHNHPYIAEIRPQPNSKGIPAADKIEILLADDAALVDGKTLQFFHNGLDITSEATISKSGGKTSISYQPNPARVDLANAVKLVYQDTAGRSYEREWGFEISAGAGVTKVTGQWDFDGDLSATEGRDMEYLTAKVEEGTKFGTTASFNLPPINGEVATVMSVPAPEGRGDRDIGYVMYHGMTPNGGGTRVNQYTLIMDVMIVGAGGAAGIMQIDSPRPGADGVIPNSGDSDFFWQGNNMGQGQGGYVGDGSFTPDEWHRVVFAVDLAGDPRLVTKYLDGVKQHDWVQQSLDQARRALLAEYSILFTDGDQDEQRDWFVNSVQIREGKMSDVEIELLGGPTAAGIPLSFFDDPNATLSSRNVFGDLGDDRGIQERRLTVFNSGETKDLEITSVTPTGPEADFFTVVAFPETLASAEEGTIVVEFDPQGATGGFFEAGLEVVSNDGGDATITLDISARINNSSGLVAHYQMDETEGTAMLDASGQRYHGSYGAAGTGSFALGQAALATGQSVKFDDGGSPTDGGGFGQLDANASIPSLQNLTISMWIQPDAADAGASMLLAKGTAAGDPFALATNAVGDNNPLLWFVQEDTEIVSDPVLSVGQPHHVVITQLDENGIELGSTRTQLYVDGALVTEVEGGNGYEDLAPSVIQIGALNGGFGFTGLIDDVQIYSRDLTADEVGFLFANPGEAIAETEPPVIVDPGPVAMDVTSPLDTVFIVNGEDDEDGAAGIPPGPEGVSNAINDIGQKYLNFLDLGSGFTVAPRAGETIVTGLRLYPANDVPERDPASYELWGSVSGPRADDFVLISAGDLDLPSERNEGGNLAITPDLPHQEVSFDNSTAYLAYRLIFPTLKDAGATNSMQIAEVELLGTVGAPVGGGELYAQDFEAADDTTDLGDGSIIASNDGTNSVQGGVLRMTAAGTNSTAASFILPPFDASAGWSASFDFTIEHTGENTPADGFSFNYGAIPDGENFGDPAEEGYGGATPHVSYQVDTWKWDDDGQDAGVGIEVTGDEAAFHKAINDDANFRPEERVSGNGIVSWDPDKGASFTTTGLRTNADFVDVATPGFTADASHGFSFLARTGGHNETLEIDNLVVGELGTIGPGGGGDLRADLGAVAVSAGPRTEAGVVDFGDLSGDATYEFSFNAIKDGASTAITGNDAWGLKLDQWNEQGVFGTTQFGVADNIFTALDGKSVDSVFGADVHVTIVSDSTGGETRLYVNGDLVGTIAGSFELAGEVQIMGARIATPVDFMGAGSVMYGWATYNTALSGDDIASLASVSFPGDIVTPGPAPEITGVSLTAAGVSLALPEGTTYDIEFSTDLVDWSVIASDVSGTYDAGPPAGSGGYYRGVVK